MKSFSNICYLFIYVYLCITTGESAHDCDAYCLNDIVDLYLSAVVAHNASKLPLASNIKYTENNVKLELYDGLWSTATRVGPYSIYVDDPEAGAVGFYGHVEENGWPGYLAVRLKVQNTLITEIETIIARETAVNISNPSPLFSENLSLDESQSRAQLIGFANGYFDTIQKSNGTLYTQFDRLCLRVENGMATAGNPDGNVYDRMGCEGDLRTGRSFLISSVRDRRFPVVDEKRGIVLSSVFFDHDATQVRYNLTDGTELTLPSPYNRPFSLAMFEMFKIKGAKIRLIEAVMVSVPYRMPSVWK